MKRRRSDGGHKSHFGVPPSTAPKQLQVPIGSVHRRSASQDANDPTNKTSPEVYVNFVVLAFFFFLNVLSFEGGRKFPFPRVVLGFLEVRPKFHLLTQRVAIQRLCQFLLPRSLQCRLRMQAKSEAEKKKRRRKKNKREEKRRKEKKKKDKKSNKKKFRFIFRLSFLKA